MLIERDKPLNRCSYGSIPHMIGSKRGPSDGGIDYPLHDIFTKKCHPRDRIIVQAKVDGSNVGIANIDGEIIALNRCGYEAKTSPYLSHWLFAEWVQVHVGLESLIRPGERLCCEWLAQVHGTWYLSLPHPIMAFDLIGPNNKRLRTDDFYDRMIEARNWLPTVPELIRSEGTSIPIEQAMQLMRAASNVGVLRSTTPPEGVVYRLEGTRSGRLGTDSFRSIAKYVQPEFEPGAYLPDVSPDATQPEWLFHPVQFGTPTTRWLVYDADEDRIRDIHGDSIGLPAGESVMEGDIFHQSRGTLTQFRAGKVWKTITHK